MTKSVSLGERPNDDREIALVAERMKPTPVRAPSSEIRFDASLVPPAKGSNTLKRESSFLEEILHSKGRPTRAIDGDVMNFEQERGGEQKKTIWLEHLMNIARRAIRVG